MLQNQKEKESTSSPAIKSEKETRKTSRINCIGPFLIPLPLHSLSAPFSLRLSSFTTTPAMAAEAVLRVVGLLILVCGGAAPSAAAMWCVARSEASEQALQIAIDYACGAGADCAPIQPNGLCYLPNTVQAHASYAFNSYYQRKNNAPDSCSFAGTSTIARTDPSYGSCVYPSSPSSAGGMVSQGGTTTGATPTTITPPPPLSGSSPLYGSGTGVTPGTGPVIPDAPLPNGSKSLSRHAVSYSISFLVIFWTM